MKPAAKTMPPRRIRKADTKDRSCILACLAAAFEEYRNQYSAKAFADTVLDSETVQRRLTEMGVLLAIAEGAGRGNYQLECEWSGGTCARDGHCPRLTRNGCGIGIAHGG